MKAILREIPADDESFFAEMARLFCIAVLVLQDVALSPFRVLQFLRSQVTMRKQKNGALVRRLRLNWYIWEWFCAIVLVLWCTGLYFGIREAVTLHHLALLIAVVSIWVAPVMLVSSLYWCYMVTNDLLPGQVLTKKVHTSNRRQRPF